VFGGEVTSLGGELVGSEVASWWQNFLVAGLADTICTVSFMDVNKITTSHIFLQL